MTLPCLTGNFIMAYWEEAALRKGMLQCVALESLLSQGVCTMCVAAGSPMLPAGCVAPDSRDVHVLIGWHGDMTVQLVCSTAIVVFGSHAKTRAFYMAMQRTRRWLAWPHICQCWQWCSLSMGVDCHTGAVFFVF